MKSDKTQLRDDPTTKSAVLGRLSKNTRVTGMNEKDGWVFVRLPDNRSDGSGETSSGRKLPSERRGPGFP